MKPGAILPVTVRGSYDNDDLGRLNILFASLSAFAADFFDQILIVSPGAEVDIIRKHCKRWTNLPLEYLAEEQLVPEFERHPRVRGWRKQQIVKLAAVRILTQPFIITFDADVICLRSLDHSTVFPEGKALLQYESRDLHPKWWKSSGAILGVDPSIGDPTIGMSVTPAILSRDICLSLHEAIGANTRYNWVDTLCRLHNPKHPNNWTFSRLRKSKWTEYSLYYLHGMNTQQIDQHHMRAGTAEVPHQMLVHDSHPFENWDVAETFSGDATGLFCVVGSKSGLAPRVVWDKVKSYIPHGDLGFEVFPP